MVHNSEPLASFQNSPAYLSPSWNQRTLHGIELVRPSLGPVLCPRTLRRERCHTSHNGGRGHMVAGHPQARVSSLLLLSLGGSPHRRDDRISTGIGELPHLLEPDASVTMVIGGVRRFQIGGESVSIDQLKVMFQKRHPYPLAAVIGMRSQKTQVVVRLVTWMGGIKAHQ